LTDNNRLPERTQVDPGRDSIRMSVPLIIFLALIVVVFLGVHQHLESQFDFGAFYFAGHDHGWCPPRSLQFRRAESLSDSLSPAP
jgi:hypothetical protein